MSAVFIPLSRGLWMLNLTFCEDERKMWCKLSLESACVRSLSVQIGSRAGEEEKETRRLFFFSSCIDFRAEWGGDDVPSGWERRGCPKLFLNNFEVVSWSRWRPDLYASLFFPALSLAQRHAAWWRITGTIFNTNHESINNWIKSAVGFSKCTSK